MAARNIINTHAEQRASKQTKSIVGWFCSAVEATGCLLEKPRKRTQFAEIQTELKIQDIKKRLKKTKNKVWRPRKTMLIDARNSNDETVLGSLSERWSHSYQLIRRLIKSCRDFPCWFFFLLHSQVICLGTQQWNNSSRVLSGERTAIRYRHCRFCDDWALEIINNLWSWWGTTAFSNSWNLLCLRDAGRRICHKIASNLCFSGRSQRQETWEGGPRRGFTKG